MPSRDRVMAFIERVVSGDHVGAIEDFYAEDASMQENGNPPRVGRALLVEHERKALARVAEMRTLPVDHFGIDGDTVFIHWIFDMVAKDGTVRRLDEISMQHWRGGAATASCASASITIRPFSRLDRRRWASRTAFPRRGKTRSPPPWKFAMP